MIERGGARLTTNGQPDTWLGANFWSRRGGPLMWRGYDPSLIRAELTVLREHGLGITRSFLYWPDFMPEPDRLDEELLTRFGDFLDRHAETGLRTIPTFIVGHMSGENWDPAWRAGRDLYGDVWLVARQAWFAREITARFAGHPAVAGWLISNEMPIYGGPADHRTIAAWAQLLVDAVRAGGGTQPVSLGDGAWGLEITGEDNGFRLRDTVPLCDFIGPHVYRMEDDRIRQQFAAAWHCELATTFGKPVVLEEFGVTSAFTSDVNGAHYYRQTLHTSLLAGATGWLAWNNTDYDTLAEQDPYRHHAFEMYFGLTDVRGVPKPQLLELRDFSRLLRAVDFGRLRRPAVDAALVVPSYLDTAHPLTEPRDRTDAYVNLRQAYVAAHLADMPVAIARESDGLTDAARLYLVPSVKALLAPSWRQLEQLAAAGATIYVSYFPGTHGNQRGPWYADLNSLFGVEHQLEYGLVASLPDDRVTLTVTTGFGGLLPGSTLTFAVAGTEHSRTFLPLRVTDAEVLATDGPGRPALVRRRVGAGALILNAYPLEHMAAMTPAVNPDDTARLYDALARAAGVRRSVTVEHATVAAETMRHENGASLVWLVNHGPVEAPVTPVLHLPGSLADLDGGPVGEAVTLAPFGVRVLRVIPPRP